RHTRSDRDWSSDVCSSDLTPGDTGFPIRLDDINPNVRIPVLVIAENYGASLLKSYLNNSVSVTATIRGDPNTQIADWDGPKGFGDRKSTRLNSSHDQISYA